MTEERTTFTVGQPIGSTPPKEGYMPILNGPSFDIVAFYSGITQDQLDDWLKGEAQYGIYIESRIPVFILDLGKAWSLDVYLNILREDEETRRRFFEGDPKHTEMHLILVSFEDAVVQAIRTIAIDPNIMVQIKEACFHQLSKFSTVEECQDTAEGILDKYNSAMLRALLRQ
jgi:hypothetical protein